MGTDHRRRIAGLALLMALAVSCTRPAPVPPTGDKPADAELAVLEHFQALADTAGRGGGECATLATDLDAWMHSHSQQVSLLMERARSEPTLSERDLARVEERIAQVLDGVLQGVRRCSDDSATQRAFQRFDMWIEAT